MGGPWARQPDHIRLVYYLSDVSATPTSLAFGASMRRQDGTVQEIRDEITTFTADLTPQETIAAEGVLKDAEIINAWVGGDLSGLKRGDMFCFLSLQTQQVNKPLASGYIYETKGLTLDEHNEPLNGEGHLDWVQEANDAAGSATTTVNLAKTNIRRIVRAVIVKIHSSGDAATRTWTITLRDLADSGGPTNWSIDSDSWASPTLTLTANEEGLIHLGEHGFLSVNDAGTITYADNTSAPNPFPLTVEEGDPVDLLIAAGSGHANDDYDVWVQYEEWIEI